ncbi:DNA helicase-2/ATP-dependent DNA helicase PcrA [Diaminobutyricimonas aerilata]|uniref:DNA 3'-5' helicase n=1 Tax=Diaminobutyricimonas aerilata TaxID=1162967 RepID=A0A2M9CI95_9MICO|nr:ATP-dependent helicase [Diaminobutyricimonas aerilata]PJJ71621.1 DNA helicase-2/ATP-dependent DNA helicase PcrA [Diaminobutyricimonas aerilata]
MVSADALLEALDDEQRRAAEALLGPVCLLAGAGTGKTRAITHRIAYGVATGVYPPGRVMALTFTTRAAGELRSRLRALGTSGVSARTFHSAALSQLSYFWPQLVGGSLPKLVESKGRLLAHAVDGMRLKLDTATLRDLASEIEWRKVSGLTIEEYERAAHTRVLPGDLTPDRAAQVQLAYENLKDERRQLDFEDVLLATAGMIEQEPRVAQQVREQYRFFVVDEYQDVSPLQHQLLELWLGDRDDVCVVGDASQTIYSFAGASSDYLLGFPSKHDRAVVIRLEQNYRSTPAIVDTANRLMRGRAGALELASAADVRGPEPVVSSHPHDSAEARAVAQQIKKLVEQGEKPESIAVLYRINVQAAALESALSDAGVSYQVRGATRFFERREVREALMMLKGASVSIMDEPLFKTVSDVLRSLGWSQQAPEARGAVREKWEALDAIMGLAEQAPAGTTLREFVDDLFARQATQHEPTVSAVTLATLHSAKGLEWDTVFLVGLSEGLVPISYAKGFDAIDEERRLMYVGITRARRRLQLSWAEQGMHRQTMRQPSRFLAELRPSTRTRDAVSTSAG